MFQKLMTDTDCIGQTASSLERDVVVFSVTTMHAENGVTL